MEGVVASWYARNTSRDLRQFSRIVRVVSERVPPGSRILELAPGPGYLAVEIARSKAYAVTGLDISHSFVRISRERAKTAGVAVDFQHGNAAQMPFSADSFDFVVCVAAFKNFGEPGAALNEIHRVLTPGGHALIHDLRKDASLDDIDNEVQAMQLSTFNAALTRWVFRHILLKSAYSSQALDELVAHSRFGFADIRTDGIAIELWLKKDG